MCEESLQEHGIQLSLEDTEAVVGLSQEAWNRALLSLLAVTNSARAGATSAGFIDAQGRPLSAESFSRLLLQKAEQKRALRLNWNVDGMAGKGGWQCLN